MSAASAPLNEAERLAMLHSLELLDSPSEPTFSAIVRLVATTLDVPIVAISLIDADRQWFASRVGLDVTETPREVAFCAHTILADDYLEIEDARADPRFSDNPLVLGPPNIRFYAGAPLRSFSGLPIGTLCVIDRHPRKLNHSERCSLRDCVALIRREIIHREAVVFARNIAARSVRSVIRVSVP